MGGGVVALRGEGVLALQRRELAREGFEGLAVLRQEVRARGGEGAEARGYARERGAVGGDVEVEGAVVDELGTDLLVYGRFGGGMMVRTAAGSSSRSIVSEFAVVFECVGAELVCFSSS